MSPSSFSTWAMEILSLEEGTPTAVFPTIWALRMRVSMSAMGSVMLMREALLPAHLDEARNLAAQRDFAQLVAPQPELAKHPARPAGQPATVAQAHGRGVPGQLLLLLACFLALFFGASGGGYRCARCRAAGGER